MCLGVPGRVVRWLRHEPPFAAAEVEFDGVCRECNLSCVPEADVGDYVVVHAGVAICRVDEAEARQVFEFLAEPPRTDHDRDGDRQ